MSLAAGVTRMGRVQAEALMSATGIIRRQTGTNPGTAPSYVETPILATIYTGPGKIRQPDGVPQTGAVPGAIVTDQKAILSLPVDATGSGNVRTDDIWEYTANPLDTSKVGQKLRITGVVSGTYITARRFPVEEIS